MPQERLPEGGEEERPESVKLRESLGLDRYDGGRERPVVVGRRVLLVFVFPPAAVHVLHVDAAAPAEVPEWTPVPPVPVHGPVVRRRCVVRPPAPRRLTEAQARGGVGERR